MQHKARVAAAKAAMDAARAAKAPMMMPPPATELPAAQTNHAYASNNTFAPMVNGQKMNKWQLQDYQMQLMLLEQQNKKRRLMYVHEQAQRVGESSRTPVGYQSFPAAPPMTTQPAQPDYEMQLHLLEEQNRKRLAMSPPMPYPVRPVPVEVEAEVRPVTVEDVADEEDIKPEAKSNMIFPKLDKESPISSTADVSAVPESLAPKSEKSETDEIFEDAESVSFVDSGDEQGFDTDEEYDILDASDEEFNA
jgi:hypothetical protein